MRRDSRPRPTPCRIHSTDVCRPRLPPGCLAFERSQSLAQSFPYRREHGNGPGTSGTISGASGTALSHAPCILGLVHQLQELSAVSVGILAEGIACLPDHVFEAERAGVS